MKKFTKAEIDEWRDKFTSRGYPRMQADFDGRSVDYFVMPVSLFRGIPNGLFRMTGNKEEGYLVGVSEEVPRLIQPPFAFSEHDEFMVYGLDDMDRTLLSEQNMIRILDETPARRANYISCKLCLYDHLLEHSKGNLEQWGFTQEDWNGFQRAYEFLQGAANDDSYKKRARTRKAPA